MEPHIPMTQPQVVRCIDGTHIPMTQPQVVRCIDGTHIPMTRTTSSKMY